MVIKFLPSATELEHSGENTSQGHNIHTAKPRPAPGPVCVSVYPPWPPVRGYEVLKVVGKGKGWFGETSACLAVIYYNDTRGDQKQ